MVHVSVACLEGEMFSHFVPQGRQGFFVSDRHIIETPRLWPGR